MSAPSPAALRLLAAERDAAAARERLSATIEEAQVRLAPRRLAREAADGIKAKAPTRPVTIGVGALLTTFLLGRPLLRRLRRPRAADHAVPASATLSKD